MKSTLGISHTTIIHPKDPFAFHWMDKQFFSYGQTIRHLKAWVSGCGDDDLLPLSSFLASCLNELVAQALRPDSQHLGGAQGAWAWVADTLKEVHENLATDRRLAMVSPMHTTVGRGMDVDPGALMESWVKGLAGRGGACHSPESQPRLAARATRWSDGIEVKMDMDAETLPPVKEFFPDGYAAQPFLDVLQGLPLTFAPSYYLCPLCDRITDCIETHYRQCHSLRACPECGVISEDLEEHYQRHHPCLSPPTYPYARQPTVEDIVRKARDFAQNFPPGV